MLFLLLVESAGCRVQAFSQDSDTLTPYPTLSSLSSLTESDPFVSQYDRLLEYALTRGFFDYPDNHRGRIAWNTSYFLDSLLNMFLYTRDTSYLDIFVRHATAVMRVRDDHADKTDFTGRARPGWQTDAYYTLGQPYILMDMQGHPSLRVQSVHISGNNHTSVRIEAEDNVRFSIEVRNDFRRSIPAVVRYEGLTMDTVESVVNAHISPRSWIRVQKIGDEPPAPGVYPLQETYVAVLHSEHTPGISIPFARFAAIVHKFSLTQYQPVATQFLHDVQESYQDYQYLWREDEQGGYFVFDPRTPIWCAGFPVPYNALALHGRFLAWLFVATGKPEYGYRAQALARKILAGMDIKPDGRLYMPYWYGRPFRGWLRPEDGPSHGLYIEGPPFNASEDTSHFTLTLQFLLDAYNLGLLEERQWAYAASQTFTDVLVSEACRDKGGNLTHSLEGNGCMAGYPAGIYARLARFQPEVWSTSWKIYREAYSAPEYIDPDYEYGYVMLGWSWLALQHAPTHVDDSGATTP